MKKLLLATAFSLAMSASAMAATMALKIQQDAGVPQTFFSAQSSFTAVPQQFGDFFISNLTGSTVPTTQAPTLLNSNTLDIQNTATGAHTLQVWITAEGLTSPTGLQNTLSGFTTLSRTEGWTVNLQTLVDLANGDFTGVLISQITYGPAGSGSSSMDIPGSATFDDLFSVTAHYTITTNGIGQANSAISLDAANTPLPAAVWMFGGGLAGLGALLRRRKKKAQEVVAA